MSFKISPKYYDYVKLSNINSFLSPQQKLSTKNLKLDTKRLSTLDHSQEEMDKAYKAYAKSSYVNYYLRNSLPMSVESNEIVATLKDYINKSEPIKGKFVRGLSKVKNQTDVENFIFNNSGFTSTAPASQKSFASTFAFGKNSAIVEFDIQKPIKGIQPNNYEALFPPNTFSKDNFNITKINDSTYKVSQK